MELIIKGDGSVFRPSIKDTATISGGCVAVFCGQHFMRLVRLALPCFPAVHGGYIRIEGTCSPAETFFVDFTVVNLIGDTLRFITVFGDTIQGVVRTVMMAHPSANVIAVAVPFCIVALGFQNIGNGAAQYLIALSPAVP